MLPPGKALFIESIDLVAIFILMTDGFDRRLLFVHPFDMPFHAMHVVVRRETTQGAFEDARSLQDREDPHLAEGTTRTWRCR